MHQSIKNICRTRLTKQPWQSQAVILVTVYTEQNLVIFCLKFPIAYSDYHFSTQPADHALVMQAQTGYRLNTLADKYGVIVARVLRVWLSKNTTTGSHTNEYGTGSL